MERALDFHDGVSRLALGVGEVALASRGATADERTSHLLGEDCRCLT